MFFFILEHPQIFKSGQQSATYESSFHFTTAPQIRILRSFLFIVQNNEDLVFIGRFISPDQDEQATSNDSSGDDNKNESGGGGGGESSSSSSSGAAPPPDEHHYDFESSKTQNSFRPTPTFHINSESSQYQGFHLF